MNNGTRSLTTHGSSCGTESKNIHTPYHIYTGIHSSTDMFVHGCKVGKTLKSSYYRRNMTNRPSCTHYNGQKLTIVYRANSVTSTCPLFSFHNETSCNFSCDKIIYTHTWSMRLAHNRIPNIPMTPTHVVPSLTTPATWALDSPRFQRSKLDSTMSVSSYYSRLGAKVARLWQVGFRHDLRTFFYSQGWVNLA